MSLVYWVVLGAGSVSPCHNRLVLDRDVQEENVAAFLPASLWLLQEYFPERTERVGKGEVLPQ